MSLGVENPGGIGVLGCEQKTLFLPGISPSLYGRRKQHRLESLRLARQSARADSIADYGALFDDILPAEELEKA